MKSLIVRFACLTLVLLATSCESTKSSAPRRNGGSRLAEQDPRNPIGDVAQRTAQERWDSSHNDSPSQSRGNETAVYGKIENASVTLYQPKTHTTLILVNQNNVLRTTRNGRLRLANGSPMGYMVQSDRQIDALLKSFDNRGQQLIRQPWRPKFASYLKGGEGKIRGLRGIIVVENNGKKWVYLGQKPSGRGDQLGQERYRVFIQLKSLMLTWYNSTGSVELIDQAAVGVAPPAFGN